MKKRMEERQRWEKEKEAQGLIKDRWKCRAKHKWKRIEVEKEDKGQGKGAQGWGRRWRENVEEESTEGEERGGN